jgi:hypothetical protein
MRLGGRSAGRDAIYERGELVTSEAEKQEALRQARANLEIRFDERDNSDEIIARHLARQRQAEASSLDDSSKRRQGEAERSRANSAAWNDWLNQRMDERFDLERSLLVETLGECIRADLDETVAQFKKLLRDQHDLFELRLRSEIAQARLDYATKLETTILAMRQALHGDGKVIDLPPVPPSRSVN